MGHPIEIFAAASFGLLVLTALVVAARTFALWRHTRGAPELLLGLYLTCATVLGYPLMTASTRIPPTEMMPLHLGAQVVTNLGFVSLLLFTLKVFRPGETWARAVVLVSILMLGASGIVYFLELTAATPRGASELIGLNLFSSLPIAFAYAWTTVESFHYHRQLRRRLRLGLADPTVTNRVLLWGLMTLSGGIAVVISMLGMLLAGTLLSPSFVLVLSCIGILSAGCLFLAFHPPRWYKARLHARAAADA